MLTHVIFLVLRKHYYDYHFSNLYFLFDTSIDLILLHMLFLVINLLILAFGVKKMIFYCYYHNRHDDHDNEYIISLDVSARSVYCLYFSNKKPLLLHARIKFARCTHFNIGFTIIKKYHVTTRLECAEHA